MKLYIVLFGPDYETTIIKSVWSTKELAEEAIKDYCKTSKSIFERESSYYTISEDELDTL